MRPGGSKDSRMNVRCQSLLSPPQTQTKLNPCSPTIVQLNRGQCKQAAHNTACRIVVGKRQQLGPGSAPWLAARKPSTVHSSSSIALLVRHP